MPGGSLKVMDSAGRQIAGAIDDQPLRVQLELDIDPKTAPDVIEVTVIGPDGTPRPVRAERIDWGAKHPLYQSDLTTIDDIFEQFLEGLNPIFGHAPEKVTNGDTVRFEYEGLDQSVQTFDSAIDARYLFAQEELADRIGSTATSGINLTNALRQLRRYPESENRSKLEAKLESRLRGIRNYLYILDHARKALDNPKYYMEQQIRAAHFYMGLSDIRDSMGIHQVLESAKETAHGHIISGVATITLGGYQMLAQATGVAQIRTMIFGEDEMGREVGWAGRVVAFLDLVADGMLQGANMKFQLDNIVAPTRIRTPDMRPRYKGSNPEMEALELSIVDPSQMGMPPEAVRAAFRAARMSDTIPLVRPTNPAALSHLADGHLPKPESLKSKTVNEIDTLLGMDPEHRALVALFEPKTTFFETAMRTSGMNDADIAAKMDQLRGGTAVEAPPGFAGTELWDKATGRFIQRSKEFDGSTGVSTRKMVEEGTIRIEDGLIVDVETGKHFTGDHDLYDFVDKLGRSVSPEVYTRMVAFLESSEFRAQHGAHKWWDPKRSDFPPGKEYDAKFETYRGIYEKIIGSHTKERVVKRVIDGVEVDVVVRGEILIAFPPVGPPIAFFAGTVPKPYLGFTPGPWAPVVKGSSFALPAEISFLGAAGLVRSGLVPDDSVTDWIGAEGEFRAGMEAGQAAGSVDAFDDAAAAAAARYAQFDADNASDEDFDVEEFAADSDGGSGGRSVDASDAAAVAAAAAAAAARQTKWVPKPISNEDFEIVEIPQGSDAGAEAGSDAGSTDAMDASADAGSARYDPGPVSSEDFEIEEISQGSDAGGEAGSGDGSVEAFDEAAKAAGDRYAEFDAAAGSEEGFDAEEFAPDSEAGGEAGSADGSVEAFDAAAAEAGARFDKFDEETRSGDGEPDLDEFDAGGDSADTGGTAGATGSSMPSAGLMAAAAAAAAVLLIGGFLWLSGGSSDEVATTTSIAASGAGSGIADPTEPEEPEDTEAGGVGGAEDATDPIPPPPVTIPPVPVIAEVSGELDWIFGFDDGILVESVTHSNITMEFPTTGGPFVGSAVLELLHDVPRDGCSFQSVHEWEFFGDFDAEKLEFVGTFVQMKEQIAGNCGPDDLNLTYLTPDGGDFIALLLWGSNEIWGSAFSQFTMPVDEEVIESVLNPYGMDDVPAGAKPQVFLFGFPTPMQLGEPGPVRFSVYVQNTGLVPWTVSELTDEVFGDLLGVAAGHIDPGEVGSSNCAEQEWALEPGGFELCNFYVDMEGPSPREQLSSISVKVVDGDGQVAAAAQATEVTLKTGGALLIVEKFADPVQVGTNGGPVTFTVRVTNLGSDVVALGALHDDVYGDLLSVANPRALRNRCPAISRQLPPQQAVECTFVGLVTPTADGEPHENTVSALAISGGEPIASAASTATVTFAE